MRDAWKYLVGSIITYAVVAACSAAGDPRRQGSTGSAEPEGNATGAAGPQSGNGASAGAGVGAGVGVGVGAAAASAGGTPTSTGGSPLDSILDPVPDADAAEDGTRLKVIYQVSADGLKVPITWQYFDSELGIECAVHRATDGKQRCLPNRSAALTAFTDTSCTQPIVLFASDSCASGVPSRVIAVDAASLSCGSYSYEAYSVGSAYAGSVYYKSGANCVDASASYASYTKHQVTKLAPSQFAEVTTTHE